VIDIRCKVCNRLAFKACEDAIGVFETRCNKCGRKFTVALPLKTDAEASGAQKDLSVKDNGDPLGGYALISRSNN
jgi:hypothetical protein